MSECAQVVYFEGDAVDPGDALVVGDIPALLGFQHPLSFLWSAMREACTTAPQTCAHDEAHRACLLGSIYPPHSAREELVADFRERHASVWGTRNLIKRAMGLLPAGQRYAIIIRGPLAGVEDAARWLPAAVTIYCHRERPADG